MDLAPAHAVIRGMKLSSIADPLLDHPCLGFSVLAWLPADPRWQALQSALSQRIPLALWFTPLARMHVSLQLLIPVREQRDDKEASWRGLHVDARRELRECAKLPPFTLVFDELRVLERAIILVAREDDVVRTIRERFVALLARAHLPAPRHEIIHTTLARYRESGELVPPEVRIDPIHVRVHSLHLVRERSYGLGDYDELEQSSLVGREPPHAK